MIGKDWKVGDRVVCVDADHHGKYYPFGLRGLDGLQKDAVYTIRRIGIYGGGNTLSIWLEEIHRPIQGRIEREHGEVGYAVQRFRPVQPRKTDISVFTALLHTNKQKEPAQ